MQIKPFIVGSGMSGQAIAKALAIIDIVDPEISVEPPVRLARDQPLAGLAGGHDLPLLCIGNPHGLHARYVLEAQRAGFRAIVVDKPPCVNRDELAELRALASAHGDRLQVAVLHGYRQMWGPQRMRQMIAAGELGELIAIEGTYWQSSAAELAVLDPPTADKSWKSDPVLGGPHDTYVDLASHWVDLVLFLAGERPQAARRWLSSRQRAGSQPRYLRPDLPAVRRLPLVRLGVEDGARRQPSAALGDRQRARGALGCTATQTNLRWAAATRSPACAAGPAATAPSSRCSMAWAGSRATSR